jgi:DNA-binding phage protein
MNLTIMKSHDEATVEMLKREPELAEEYLRAALEEIDEPGGEMAFLAALRQVALAQGETAALSDADGMIGSQDQKKLPPSSSATKADPQ